MRPRDAEMVIREELNLQKQEKRDRSHDQRGPRDGLEQAAEATLADVVRAGKKLNENVAARVRRFRILG